MSDDTIFDEALEELNKRIQGMDVNSETLMTILKFAMEVVETTTLKGEAQKDLATKLVRQVIVNAPIADEKEKLLLDIIDENILGNTVDLIIATSKGELKVNDIVEVATGCCAVFLKNLKK
jgi:hypothetical protein